jgi:HK97 family phage major capsid protein
MTPRVAAKLSTETLAATDYDVRSFLWGAMPNMNHSPSGIGVRVGEAQKRLIHEQRDLSKLSAGAGGNVVATTFAERLYEHMVETSGVRRTGAVVFTTDGGQTLLVPKTTGQSSAALVAEAGTIAESDPAFGQASLGAFGYKLLVQVSQELEQDTEVDLLGYLARQAGRAIGLASGAHFVTGTGTGQPEGVQTNSTVGAQAPSGNTTTVHPDTLIAVFHSVASGYREQAVWLMNDATKLKLAQLKEATTNQYVWRPGLTAGAPDLLLGRPIVTDPAMPAVTASSKPIVFGDFSAGYAIRDVAEVRFHRSQGFAFSSGLVTGYGRWVNVPPSLYAAVLKLCPRDDRHSDRRVFENVTADRLRTAISRACTAAGVPVFSPHDLRHRRISLLHLGGVPWATIGHAVGQRDLAVTANTYSHVLADETELDYAALLA